MKRIKLILCAALATVLLFTVSGLFACKQRGGEKIDKARTQLYVHNLDAGYRNDWLLAVKPRFENAYKDIPFESGKTGVQVMITGAKTFGTTLRAQIKALNSEVFFNESVNYYDYLADNLLLDITDVVTDSLAEYGDTGTIEDKMTADQIDFFNVDGKYYGVPHYVGYEGIVYDAKLFEDYMLYFKDGAGSSFISSPDNKRSAGPDGVYDTADDGLPATYDEFFKLCDYMVELGITPFVWTGKHSDTYLEKAMYAMSIDHDGLEQGRLNYTFRGTAKNIINPVGSDKKYSLKYGSEGVQITPENGYLTWASEGKYLAMSFWERVIRKSSYYGPNVFSPSHMHLDAQKDFLESTPKGKPIAMIVEGTWWESEANDSIKLYADYYGEEYSQENRKFAMMPFPKASTEKIGQKRTLVDLHYSLGFIKASIAGHKIDLAKKFLKFCNTEESLTEFSTITNSAKALRYDMDSASYEAMSYFGKSVYNMQRNSDVVYPFSSEKIYLNNQDILFVDNAFGSTIGTQEESRPLSYIRKSQSNTAELYFNGMLTFNQERWNRVFGAYFS